MGCRVVAFVYDFIVCTHVNLENCFDSLSVAGGRFVLVMGMLVGWGRRRLLVVIVRTYNADLQNMAISLPVST